VPERADHPPPTVGGDVPGGPHGAHAGVHGEDGIVSGNFVQDARSVFGVDRGVMLDIVRVGVDHLFKLARVLVQHAIQKRPVGFLLDERQHGPQRLADITMNGQVQQRAPPDAGPIVIDLHRVACGRNASYGKSVPSRTTRSASCIAS
jgi:hypothetical protein